MNKITSQARPAVFVSAILLAHIFSASQAIAQDAFGTGEKFDYSYGYPTPYATGTQTNSPELDGFTCGHIGPTSEYTTITGVNTSGSMSLNQEGVSTINGEFVPIREREFRKCTRLPDARALLGESICDLSDRPIACDEVKAPKGFPPMPKQITVGRFQDAEVHHDADSEPVNFRIPINLSGKGPLFSLPSQGDQRNLPPEIMVPASTIQALSDANQLASDNPDFDCRFAAYCMQLQHTGSVPTYLDGPMSILRQAVGAEPNAIIAMANLKTAIAKIPPSPKSAPERAVLAAKLESQRKYYDALVERLRVAEMTSDGPSKLRLADLYMTLKENKLGFETLREAAENWSGGDKLQLAEVHEKMGNHIFSLANEAKKRGNVALGLVRLRNASACYRRALCLNPQKVECAQSLVRVCREACCFDQSYENQLMLGGALLLGGNLDKAEEAYNECARIRNDGRLGEARQVLAAARKRPSMANLQAKVVPSTESRSEPSPF